MRGTTSVNVKTIMNGPVKIQPVQLRRKPFRKALASAGADCDVIVDPSGRADVCVTLLAADANMFAQPWILTPHNKNVTARQPDPGAGALGEAPAMCCLRSRALRA